LLSALSAESKKEVKLSVLCDFAVNYSSELITSRRIEEVEWLVNC
jgi:hypothetical protein